MYVQAYAFVWQVVSLSFYHCACLWSTSLNKNNDQQIVVMAKAGLGQNILYTQPISWGPRPFSNEPHF